MTDCQKDMEINEKWNREQNAWSYKTFTATKMILRQCNLFWNISYDFQLIITFVSWNANSKHVSLKGSYKG